MSFDNDLALSLKSRVVQDEVYTRLWTPKSIVRFDRADNMILDRLYHIDVAINLANNSTILGQEKALRAKFAHFNTFTIEFYQNRHSKEEGEFFNLCAQFYFHGYLNEAEDSLDKWVVIKIFDWLAYLRDFNKSVLEKYTKPTMGSRASFFQLDYKKIPKQFIYESYNIC